MKRLFPLLQIFVIASLTLGLQCILAPNNLFQEEHTTKTLFLSALYCGNANTCLITLNSILENEDYIAEDLYCSEVSNQDCDVQVQKMEEKPVVDGTVWEIEPGELDILQRIVEAEAGGEDLEGKMLVANVVLNRVKEDDFPDTIEEVVYQNKNGSYQFSPAGSGRIDRVEVSQETVEAVENVLHGEDHSEGALFFVARKHAKKSSLKWFESKLQFLFRHGGHEFYK